MRDLGKEYYMNEEVQTYINKYPKEIIELYTELRTLIYSSTSQEIEEKLWAKLPSYYVGDSFIRLIPFKAHINIEAKGILQHKEELDDYKLTPKGMLQISFKQNIPTDILVHVFKETLESL